MFATNLAMSENVIKMQPKMVFAKHKKIKSDQEKEGERRKTPTQLAVGSCTKSHSTSICTPHPTYMFCIGFPIRFHLFY